MRLMKAQPIIKLEKFDDNKLLRLFHNALNLIEKENHVDAAYEQISLIENEWASRVEKYMMGVSKSTRPDNGLLSTMGYKVGNDGVSKKRREILLTRILTHTIPFCGSPAYMYEWGGPNTRKRYNKLTTVIQLLIIKKKYIPGIEKAIIEWSEDLIYLKENYRNAFPKPYIN
jgi:hypothetical protein